MSYLFPTYAKWDVAIEKAEGSYAYDANGKKYLDFISGIAVCNLGHCPKQVVDAIAEQLQKVWHTSNLFHIPLQEEVAKQLVEHSSGDAVFLQTAAPKRMKPPLNWLENIPANIKSLHFTSLFTAEHLRL